MTEQHPYPGGSAGTGPQDVVFPPSTPAASAPWAPSETASSSQPPHPPLPSVPAKEWRPTPTREVTHLPPPTGANWGQIAFGLVAVVVGFGVFANQVAGFEIRSVTSAGPTALVSAGLVCALFGVLGMFRRRR